MPHYTSTMLLSFLLVATTILPTVVNSSPLLRVDENTIDLTAAAADDNKAFYEHVQESYIGQGCPSTWGDFPSSKTLSRSRTLADRRPATTAMTMTTTSTATDAMPCMCGMLHSLGFLAITDYSKEDEIITEAVLETGTSSSSSTITTTKLSPSTIARTENSESVCVNGIAEGTSFPCNSVDLVAHLPLNRFETTNTNKAPITANDIWGWTYSPSDENNRREFVLWGVEEGHYFLEVTDSSNPTVLGFLPSNTFTSSWHDVKVIGDFAYMGSEAADHGLQIFDLKKLLDIDPATDCVTDKYCTELEADVVYTGPADKRVRNTHNMVANAESNFMYLVGGTNGCNGGLHIVDVSDPLNPEYVACFGDDGYVHDAQCVNYKGPDPNYTESEICFCFNEDTVTIVDVTDKSDISIISKTFYEDKGYTHQGWLSSDQTHVVFGDETDEYYSSDNNYKTRTLILDIKDLSSPTNFQEYYGTTSAIDHNLYILPATAPGQEYDSNIYGHTDLIYQANYMAGLRILQVLDYDSGAFEEVGFFDTYVESDATQFNGAWSVYPFFASGLIAISSIREGLFLVKPNLEDSLIDPTTTSSPTLAPTPFPCSDGIVFQLELKIDNYGEETSWTLKESDSLDLIAEGLKEEYAANSEYTESVCLNKDTCYTFEIMDTFGDGICCSYNEGYYRGNLNGVEIFDGGDFKQAETKNFCTEGVISPTKTPTRSPSASPSASPTEDGGDIICVDSDDLNYSHKGKNKGCDWIGKPRRNNQIRSRCKRKSLGIKIFDYCLETCGKVGLGDCKGEFGF